MAPHERNSQFSAPLLRPLKLEQSGIKAFVVLPKNVSDTLPRRGRTTVDGSINGRDFRITLEPDGKLSHWLPIDAKLLKASGCAIGEKAQFTVRPTPEEPEPKVPADFMKALKAANAEVREAWDEITTLARVDFIHWIVSAKQDKTRAQRIHNACDMLEKGKKRVCCFDPSGFYSKALAAPKNAE